MVVWLDALYPDRISHMQPDRSTRGAKGSRRALGAKELSDLWDTRCSLETVAVRHACRNSTPNDLDELRRLAAERAVAALWGDLEAGRYDREIHRAIIRVSGNSVIDELFSINPLSDDTSFHGPAIIESHSETEQVLQAHAQLIDAMSRRDEDDAEEILRRLLEMQKQRCLRRLGNDRGSL